MSSSALHKLTKKILSRLESKKFREQLLNHPGQVFIFNKTQFIISVGEYLNLLGIPKNEADEVINKLVLSYEKKLESAQRAVKSQYRESLKRTIMQIVPTLPKFNPSTDKAYFVSSYNSITSIKNVIGKQLEEYTNGKAASNYITGQVEKGSSSKVGFHTGHGDYGTAVSATRILAAESVLSTKYAKGVGGSEKLSDILVKYKKLYGVSMTMDATRVITATGKLKQEYNPILSSQLAEENLIDAKIEGELLRNLKKEIYSLLDPVNQEGSPTLKQDIASILLNTLVGKSKTAKVKSTVKKAKQISRNSKSGKAKGTITTNRTAKVTSGSGVAVPNLNIKEGTGSQIDLKSLIPVVNANLHNRIQENMGNPRLNYRTGRFARSVRVLDISQTAKGFPSISYTYQKDPYSVFEFPTGSPRLASPHRDPKALIDKSIRDIAKGLIGQRFYTKRV